MSTNAIDWAKFDCTSVDEVIERCSVALALSVYRSW